MREPIRLCWARLFAEYRDSKRPYALLSHEDFGYGNGGGVGVFASIVIGVVPDGGVGEWDKPSL